MDESVILQAAMDGDLPTLIKYIEDDSVDILVIQDAQGNNIMHLAAKYGRVEILNFIELRRCAESRNDGDVEPPVKKSKFPYLFQDLRRQKNVNQQCPDHLAAIHDQPECLERLLADGPLLARDNCGRTSLHYAIMHENEACVRVICSNVGNREQRLNDKLGMYPVHYACQVGKCAILSLLHNENHHSLMDVDNTNKTCLMYAVLSNSVECVDYLIRKHPPIVTSSDHFGRIALHYAVRDSSVEIAAILMNKLEEEDIFSVDDFDQTPLDIAICAGRGEMMDLFFCVAGRKPKGCQWTSALKASLQGNLNQFGFLMEGASKDPIYSVICDNVLQMICEEQRWSALNLFLRFVQHRNSLSSAGLSKVLEANHILELLQSNGSNAQSNAAEILPEFGFVENMAELNDVVLISIDETEVASNRLILMYASLFFRRMFSGEFTETANRRVSISICGQCLSYFLHVLYSRRVPYSSCSLNCCIRPISAEMENQWSPMMLTFFQRLCLADYLDSAILKKYVTHNILPSVTPRNAFGYLDIAKIFEIPLLYTQCQRVILKEWFEVFGTKEQKQDFLVKLQEDLCQASLHSDIDM